MKSFASALSSANALSTPEMKNVKGGGNCGFLHESPAGGYVICGLDESQEDVYSGYDGVWCCGSCGKIGC